MDRFTLGALSITAWVSTAGCSGAEPDAIPPGGVPVDTVPTTDNAPPQPTVTIQGFVHGPDGTALSGANVCVEGGPNKAADGCTTSREDGSFSVAAPAEQALIVTFRKDGFLTVARAVETHASEMTLPEGENVLSPAVTPATFLGTRIDPTKGQVAFNVMTPGAGPAPEVTVTLTGGDGRSLPPIYLDADGAPAPMATTGSRGGFANVPDGMVVLRFGRNSVTCTASDLYGFPLTAFQDPTSGQAAVMVPVLAGSITAPVAVSCTQ